MGIGWTREEGRSADNGFVHWDNVYNKPNMPGDTSDVTFKTVTATGKLRANVSANAKDPNGWTGGITTFDLYSAGGTIGAGDANGNVKSYISRDGVVYSDDKIVAKKQLCIDDLCLSKAQLTAIINSTTGIYVFDTFRFRSVKKGAFGMTLQEARSMANSIPSQYINMTVEGIINWTVPRTGTYRIQAGGAPGNGMDQSRANMIIGGGGRGRILQGEFALTASEIVSIAIGQCPKKSGNTYECAAGGGTFVVVTRNNAVVPLVIAGGGGGNCGHNSPSYDILDGQVNENAQASVNSNGQRHPGGANGRGGPTGGHSATCAGQGAGFEGDAGTTTCGNISSGIALSFKNARGPLGGTASCRNNDRNAEGSGGYGGGGGGGCGGGGGGGGYSGGAGSYSHWDTYGSGGGSYLHPSLTLNGNRNVGVNNSAEGGYVTITVL
jgi:hypothetical protein